VVCLPSTLSAQITPPPCRPETPFVNYALPQFTNGVQINTSMPLNVIIANIVLDSLKRSMTLSKLDSLENTITYSDTLKTLMKQFYLLQDYNPQLFEQNVYSNKSTYNNFPFSDELVYTLSRVLDRVSPQPVTDRLLTMSSFIAHVTIIDTIRHNDTSARVAFTPFSVTAHVNELIKGKVLPPCTNLNPSLQQASTLVENEQVCLQFVYALEQRLDWRFDNTSDYRFEESKDTNGLPWIKKSKEYILFLKPSLVCSDSANMYFVMRQLNIGGLSGMYPIDSVTGIVSDPFDDFGFGTGLTKAQFIAALKAKITTLLSY
jgi:hypothetical protein